MATLPAQRAFLILRYTLIVATAYLLVVERNFATPPVGAILLIVAALASNVAIAQLPERVVRAQSFAFGILVFDTVWITVLLLESGQFNAEFFYLYFFVLLLAAIGESLSLIAVGAVAVSIGYLYVLTAGGQIWSVWSSPSLIRIPFLFIMAAFYGYLVDRTRQERRRADVREFERQQEKKLSLHLRQSLEKEKQLGDLKSQFVSMVSHEFRTPLTAIFSATDVLSRYGDKLTPQDRARRFEKIQAQVLHMTALMEDVLAIGKVDGAAVDFEPRPVQLKELCEDVVEEVEGTAKPPRRIDFSYSGAQREGCVDPKHLRNLLSNLLANAVKYSPDGTPIHFEVVCQKGTALFRVRDCGIGIPADDREHLFEPFHRSANAGGISGTGLGLVIVKRSVDLHGGTIAVDSEVNRGTTFTVTLPLVGEEERLADSSIAV